ncbi:MAG TPA: PIN domain-containing protein [Desulfobacterales bacterium]|nr:PIN domain-containing protein [Desulfobacterales bacterium]
MDTGIIADTCVWIEFFRNRESELTRHLKEHIKERKVTMVGMVLAEILQGIRTKKEAGIVKESLKKLPYLEATWDAWEKAGELSRDLRRKGTTIPLSDLIIASIAIIGGNAVLTIDPHFQHVPGLKLKDLPLQRRKQPTAH